MDAVVEAMAKQIMAECEAMGVLLVWEEKPSVIRR